MFICDTFEGILTHWHQPEHSASGNDLQPRTFVHFSRFVAFVTYFDTLYKYKYSVRVEFVYTAHSIRDGKEKVNLLRHFQNII